jgi:hypothetical protein
MESKDLQAAISSELGSSGVTPRNLLCALRRLSERCVELTADWSVSTKHSMACDAVKPYTPTASRCTHQLCAGRGTSQRSSLRRRPAA